MSQLTRRQALQTATASAAALALAPLAVQAEEKAKGKDYYTLPPLPYAYDALKVSIDELTMRIHHDKHHAGYIANAKKILAATPKLLAMPVEELLADIKKLVPAKSLQGAINNVGGHSNHSIFWTVMGPKSGTPAGALGKAIDKHFGSLDKFQKEFSQAGMTQFGSGWAWLVADKKGELKVIKRANQDSPIMDGYTPLLGLDVWEHAYYLRYKNARASYVEAWWKVVNWANVAERHAKAIKG